MKSGQAPGKIPSYEFLLAASCGVGFLSFFGSYMRMPVVPLYAGQVGADALQVGLINASFLSLTGMLSLPLGILSDRIERKWFILWGLFMSTVTSLLLIFCTTPRQMMGAYIFFGLGQAALAPTMMSYVADFSPKARMGRSYGWYTLAIYAGMSIGPAAGGAVAQWMGYQVVFGSSGGLLFVVLFLTFLFLPRAKDLVPERAPALPFLALARTLVGNPPLVACWLVTLGACMGMGTFLTFAPLHAKEQGLMVGQIGLIFGAQALFNALSRLPFGHLSDKVSSRNHLVVAGLTCFALCVAAVGAASSFSTFVLSSAGVGFSMGIGFTAIGALMTELVEPNCRGLAMGGYNSAIYLGMMLGALTMGAVVERIGFRHGFFMIAFINLLMTSLFHLIFTRSRRQGSAP